MASYRTQLALDRTTLAWIRTALTLASFGFGMVAFFRSFQEQAASERTIRLHHDAVRIGTALCLLGIITLLLVSLSHGLTLRRLRRGEPPVLSRFPLSILMALLAAVIGLAGLWFVFMQ